MSKKNKTIKTYTSFLKSMKCGLILLAMVSAISVIGSIVPQGYNGEFYQHRYGSPWANIILALKFDDIYHAWYFIILSGILCLNLLLCSVTRINLIIKRIKKIPDYRGMKKLSKTDIKSTEVKDLFKVYGFRRFNILEGDNNKTIYYSKKNKISYLGSWFIHVGVLLIIVFYGYGQFTYFSTSVYGVPGEVKEVQGTNYQMEIQDFYVDYREDGSVQQYISNLQLLNREGDTVKLREVYVNNPMRHKGYTFYQTATGWATDFKIYRGDELIKEDVFYEATAIIEEREDIAIQFTRFYPDFHFTQGGIVSVSNQPNNPRVLYSIFFRGQRVAMNVAEIGEFINWHNYHFVFDNPRMYTYLQVNKMYGKLGAMLASALVMLGLIICFYLKPKEMVVIPEGNKLVVFGNDRK